MRFSFRQRAASLQSLQFRHFSLGICSLALWQKVSVVVSGAGKRFHSNRKLDKTSGALLPVNRVDDSDKKCGILLSKVIRKCNLLFLNKFFKLFCRDLFGWSSGYLTQTCYLISSLWFESELIGQYFAEGSFVWLQMVFGKCKMIEQKLWSAKGKKSLICFLRKSVEESRWRVGLSCNHCAEELHCSRASSLQTTSLKRKSEY